jgi:hypothetical protein
MYDLREDKEFPQLFRMLARPRLRFNRTLPDGRDLTDDEVRQIRALISSRKRSPDVMDALADVAADKPIKDRDHKGVFGAGVWDWIKENWTTILKVLLMLLMVLGDEEAPPGIKAMKPPETEEEAAAKVLKSRKRK